MLAAAESVDANGDKFLVALACAYRVHTCPAEVAPVRNKGFDLTVQGAYAVAAGVSRALRLSAAQTANAMAAKAPTTPLFARTRLAGRVRKRLEVG